MSGKLKTQSIGQQSRRSFLRRLDTKLYSGHTCIQAHSPNFVHDNVYFIMLVVNLPCLHSLHLGAHCRQGRRKDAQEKQYFFTDHRRICFTLSSIYPYLATEMVNTACSLSLSLHSSSLDGAQQAASRRVCRPASRRSCWFYS